MKPFVIELDDRAVSLARGGHVLSSIPSAVYDGSVGVSAGTVAWNALRSQPMATSTRHLGSILSQRTVLGAAGSPRARALTTEELRKRLAAFPIATDERAWIVCPARSQPTGLGALLAITRELELPVDGFVDSAAVTVAALAVEGNAVVLELGLHHAAATAVDAEAGQARRRRTVVAERGGLIELAQAWLDLIGTTMVKRTRFDPLHDAATEQQLFNALPALAREAAAMGNTTAVVTRGAEQFQVELSRDQFVRAGEPVFRALSGLLHQLRPAGAPVAIVAPQFVAGLPGSREEFEQFVGCELVLIPDGFAAAATSLLDLPPPLAEPDSARLLRRLPLQPRGSLAEAAAREVLGKRRSGGPPPSHVLFDGRAYSLATDSLIVGRGRGITLNLPDGLAGVSRRHCTFVHDKDEWVLLDHSTFGTFVNGERVAERVRVHAGDRVRLGTPGVELALIAVGDGDRGSACASDNRS
jgi:hypothetical protein